MHLNYVLLGNEEPRSKTKMTGIIDIEQLDIRDFEIEQTGKQNLTLTRVNIPITKATSSTSTPDFVPETPYDIDNYGDKSIFQSGNKEIKFDETGTYWHFLVALQASAFTLFLNMQLNNDIPTEDSSSLLGKWTKDFTAGYLAKLPDATNNDESNNASSLEEVAEGLAWCDHILIEEDLGTNPRHYNQVKRYAYMMGVALRKQKPKLTGELSRISENVRLLHIQIIAAAYASTIPYLYLIGAIQSERDALNMGYLRNDLISEKLPALGNSIDPIWLEFVKKVKPDWLGSAINRTTGTEKVMAVSTLTSDLFNYDWLDETTIDAVLTRLKTTFVVPDWCIKVGRQLFGTSEFTANDEQAHFNIMLNLCRPTDSGSYDDVDYKWYAGWNIMIVYNYLRAMKDMEIPMLQILDNDHWTWKTGIKEVITSIWTPYNFIDYNRGISEPDAYRAMRRLACYDVGAECATDAITDLSKATNAWEILKINGIPLDPTNIEYSGTLPKGYAQSNQLSHAPLLLMLPYLQTYHYYVGAIYDDRDCLLMAANWNLNELWFEYWYELLFSRQLSAVEKLDRSADNDGKPNIWSQRFVEFFDCYDPTIRRGIAFTSSTDGLYETPRYEDILDVNNLDTWASISCKYLITIDMAHLGAKRSWMASRPFGIKGVKPQRIQHVVTEPDTLLEWIGSFFEVAKKSAAPSTTVTSATPPTDATQLTH